MSTPATAPEPSLHDLAAELTALRARVTKLESVVTFWVHPEKGEMPIIRCKTVVCDHLRIDSEKPGEGEGPREKGSGVSNCGIPEIRLRSRRILDAQTLQSVEPLP